MTNSEISNFRSGLAAEINGHDYERLKELPTAELIKLKYEKMRAGPNKNMVNTINDFEKIDTQRMHELELAWPK